MQNSQLNALDYYSSFAAIPYMPLYSTSKVTELCIPGDQGRQPDD
jgi:hypothetical protein